FHPEFIRDGRFGEWLRENVDWAISRERYWGMPLPIWVCSPPAGGCGREEIIGSLHELDQKGPKDTTKVFLMRHGEADHNVKGLVGPATVQHDTDNHLTPKGKKQVQKSAKLFKKIGADIIISSLLNRAKETAKIVSEELNIPIEVNEHIYDYDVGDFHGRSIEETAKTFPYERRFQEPFPNGESLRDVRARMMRELDLIIKKYVGKKILIISHGDPLWVLHAARSGILEEEYQKSWYPKTAEVKELTLHNWPYNKSGELDMHRPYMDAVKLSCPKCEHEMQRVREVADVWFDSGAMPFAQDHYPFRKGQKLQYPADYIAEAIDQTRGWFYTLLAVSSLLNKPAAYKNVLSLGFVLDEKGEKMSKSRGNIVEPLPLFDQYGADATRWYFYTINQPWDEKLFRKSDIADASRRFLNILWNSFMYWKTYKINPKPKTQNPKLLINKWIVMRLNKAGYEVTRSLEKFDVTRAARTIEHFVVEDLSHWYIRRIRDAIRFGSKKEQEEISSVFGFVLYTVSCLSAPFIPFLTERMYQEAGGKGSIHFEKWPKYKKLSRGDEDLIKEMDEVRRIVSSALEARAKANIKVRQPLAMLKIKNYELRTKNKELLDLIKGEVNVKEMVFDKSIKNEVEIDITITKELKEEGQARELIRRIQAERKKKGFEPKDKIVFVVLTDEEGKAFIKKYEKTLKRETGTGEIVFSAEGGSASGGNEKDVLQGKTVVSLKFHV
ncbi:class I tRNA ligase family protein, partial [Patescibacteria group bacterium]|nr:class I tRNA ligase family protein [Patescibacteria group bacterium]